MVRVEVPLDGRLEEPFRDVPPCASPADLPRLVDVAVHPHPKRGGDPRQRLGPVDAADPPAGDRRLAGGAVHAPVVVFLQPGGEPGVQLPQRVRRLDMGFGEQRGVRRAPESLRFAFSGWLVRGGGGRPGGSSRPATPGSTSPGRASVPRRRDPASTGPSSHRTAIKSQATAPPRSGSAEAPRRRDGGGRGRPGATGGTRGRGESAPRRRGRAPPSAPTPPGAHTLGSRSGPGLHAAKARPGPRPGRGWTGGSPSWPGAGCPRPPGPAALGRWVAAPAAGRRDIGGQCRRMGG